MLAQTLEYFVDISNGSKVIIIIIIIIVYKSLFVISTSGIPAYFRWIGA